jgi:hypothetical protein
VPLCREISRYRREGKLTLYMDEIYLVLSSGLSGISCSDDTNRGLCRLVFKDELLISGHTGGEPASKQVLATCLLAGSC